MKSDCSAFRAFNPHIERLPVYNAGLTIKKAQEISGKTEIARLASNENPYGCSPRVKALFGPFALEPSRYPDPQSSELRQALGDRLDVAPEQIVIGNGSEELIAAISRAVLVPGDVVVTVAPAFGLHEIEPMAAGAQVVKVPLTPEMEFDVDGLCDALATRPKLVFLSSPSNPAGCILRREGLEALVDTLNPDTLFVLDEAYFEYAEDELPDSIAVLKAAAVPFIVLRTFSKAYGLAGLRVGYAVTQGADMSRAIASTRTPFDVNSAAQAAALAALKDDVWMKESVARTIAERAKMAARLRAYGFHVSQSKANSLFFNSGMDSTFIFEWLVKEGVIVKPWREPQYEEFIRVSVGTADENALFLDRLGALIAGHGISITSTHAVEA